jgi:hypothetical protein
MQRDRRTIRGRESGVRDQGSGIRSQKLAIGRPLSVSPTLPLPTSHLDYFGTAAENRGVALQNSASFDAWFRERAAFSRRFPSLAVSKVRE